MVEVESKASRAIAHLMKTIQPGTIRFELLETARNFKISWIELGDKLFQVRQKKLHKEWGHEKYEDYCRKEIRIQPRTAEKLTASYVFLKTEDPALIKNNEFHKPLPDIQVVDMLRKARSQTDIPDNKFNEIKHMAYNELEPTAVRRMLKEQLVPYKPSKPLDNTYKKLFSQANRLIDSLSSTPGIPKSLIKQAENLAEELNLLK